MALFGFTKKKKEDIPAIGPEAMPTITPTPVEAVMQMRQQGLSNNQIIQNLQREGYMSDLIFDAINQADVKGSVEAIPPGEMEQMQPLDNPVPEQGYDQYQQQQPAQQTYSYPQYPAHSGNEELVETIVNEKWETLAKELKKFDEWKEKTDANISKLQQSVTELKTNFDKLHQAIIGKISEYDQNILNVGTEIKAMEKVFQKVLPSFTENINELSRITKNINTKKTTQPPR